LQRSLDRIDQFMTSLRRWRCSGRREQQQSRLRGTRLAHGKSLSNALAALMRF